MTTYRTHHLTVSSDRSSISLIDPFLKAEGIAALAGDRYHDVLVTITEAVNNAIIHGNGGDVSKSVVLDIQTGGGEIIAVVIDHGTGFDPDSIPDPRLPENLLREGGRGVFLIRHLADEVEFTTRDDGSAILIKFKL